MMEDQTGNQSPVAEPQGRNHGQELKASEEAIAFMSGIGESTVMSDLFWSANRWRESPPPAVGTS